MKLKSYTELKTVSAVLRRMKKILSDPAYERTIYEDIGIGSRVYDVALIQHDTAIVFLPKYDEDGNPLFGAVKRPPSVVEGILKTYSWFTGNPDYTRVDFCEEPEKIPFEGEVKQRYGTLFYRAYYTDGNPAAYGINVSTKKLLIARETQVLHMKDSHGYWLFEDLGDNPYAFVLETRMLI